jgi:hypothetical protein
MINTRTVIFVSTETILLANEIGEIFAKSNNTLCTNCPTGTWQGYQPNPNSGCCRVCAIYNGHFDINNDQKQQIDHLKLEYDFNKLYGFFDNNQKTCKLPRCLRSITCLGYKCTAVENTLTKQQLIKIQDNIEIIKYTRKANNSIV